MPKPQKTWREQLVFGGIWMLWIAFLSIVFWNMNLFVLVISVLPTTQTYHQLRTESDEDT